MQDPSFQQFYLGCTLESLGVGGGGALEATNTWAHPLHLPQGAEFTWSDIGLALRIFKTSLGDFNVQPGLRPAALPHFWSKMNYSLQEIQSLYVAIPLAPTPPPQKLTIPNLAANFSWSLFPQNYFQEVLVNICWGINKPQRKTSWGYSVDGFSERSFLFSFPHYTSWRREYPFVLHLAPAGYQAGYLRRFTD